VLGRPVSRRAVLGGALSLATAAGLAACTRGTSSPGVTVGPGDPSVAAAEQARTRAGVAVHRVQLTAAPARVDLGGPVVDTWAYGGAVPGQEIRLPAGDRLSVALVNQLTDPTTVHWHGLALRNDMDGVPEVTQPAVRPGGDMLYEFTVPDPGTYWFHPHVGTQLDRGLYAPLIVEDPDEPLGYDAEHVVVLDDWVDGTGRTPDQVLGELQSMGMDMSGDGPSSAALGGDAGDVAYPMYLVNGRVPQAPNTVTFKPGTRVRLRLINAGADTAFRVALTGHRLTVTHTDGFPVQQVDGDAILIGMGERFDALVTLGDGVFALVASAEGKDGLARELIRTGSGDPPAADTRPSELSGALLTGNMLHATEDVALPDQTVDREHQLILDGQMSDYRWMINGRGYDEHQPLPVTAGQTVRLTMTNNTTMFHPMHVHGHTFQLRPSEGAGARKDTVNVLPGQTVVADLIADNPGQWLIHCHNLYHAEAGMMTTLSYRR
jgi:FtsP/CotA-like multicopper oxidase with cupredoxin domain